MTLLQQVNLLEPQLLPQKDPFGSRQLLLVWGGFATLLLVVSIWQSVSLSSLEDQKAGMAAELASLQSSLESQRRQMVPVEQLVAQIDRLETELVQREQWLAQVLTGNQTSHGFADYFAELGEARIEGLWLEQISIAHTPGGEREIVLQGQTTHAQAVPQWLRALAKRPRFRGHKFDDLQVQADPGGTLLGFTLRDSSREPS